MARHLLALGVLLAPVCAEIASWNKWSEEYHNLVALGSLDVPTSNAAIEGGTIPDTTDLQPLWRWYRAVDDTHKQQAKDLMVKTQGTSTSPLMALSAFKTDYDAVLKKSCASSGSIANADTAATDCLDKDLAAVNTHMKSWVLYDILGSTLPDNADTAPLWTKYQAFDSATKEAVTEVVKQPFFKIFRSAWKTASTHNDNKDKFDMTLALMRNTMDPESKDDAGTPAALTTPETGMDTNLIYIRMQAAEKKTLQEMMMSTVISSSRE